MKKYIKYIGYKSSSQGSYFTKGLMIDQYYEFITLTENKIFVVVINDLGEKFAYNIELFE